MYESQINYCEQNRSDPSSTLLKKETKYILSSSIYITFQQMQTNVLWWKEDEWSPVATVGWGYDMRGRNNKSAQRNFWVWYMCSLFWFWLWFHRYIHMSKLTNFYTLNMVSLLYVSHTSIKLLKAKVTVTNLYPALLLSCALLWLRLILGWNIFLWCMYTLGYLSHFLIFVFPHSDSYPLLPGTPI